MVVAAAGVAVVCLCVFFLLLVFHFVSLLTECSMPLRGWCGDGVGFSSHSHRQTAILMETHQYVSLPARHHLRYMINRMAKESDMLSRVCVCE